MTARRLYTRHRLNAPMARIKLRGFGVFLTKVHARILRPGLQVLDTHIVAQAPPRLRTLFIALDAATDSLIEEARLAA